jgi:hypothetical protein
MERSLPGLQMFVVNIASRENDLKLQLADLKNLHEILRIRLGNDGNQNWVLPIGGMEKHARLCLLRMRLQSLPLAVTTQHSAEQPLWSAQIHAIVPGFESMEALVLGALSAMVWSSA